MTDDSAERAPIGRIDLSGLPGPDPRPDPDWSTVRKVSESGGFIDRSPRTTRRHLTGPQSSIQRQGDRRHDPAVQRHLRRAAVGRRPRARTSRRVGRGGLAARNDSGGDRRA